MEYYFWRNDYLIKGNTRNSFLQSKFLKAAFSTFWFNPYDGKPSGAISERGTSHVT